MAKRIRIPWHVPRRKQRPKRIQLDTPPAVVPVIADPDRAETAAATKKRLRRLKPAYRTGRRHPTPQSAPTIPVRRPWHQTFTGTPRPVPGGRAESKRRKF
jgi:hypothetical protein